MPKASDVANELRKLADALDQHSDAEVPKLYAHFHADSKEQFVAVAKSMPRPAKKSLAYEGKDCEELHLTYKSDFLTLTAGVRRNSICTLVKPAVPAVYECEPILSLEEEESLA